ncbi:hypothetical protein QBC47DRAFT_401694 [Echria macrotheca]|uniref:Uncharacterized protein n=1 Tax=Echria macrotheca TaxID=438768 RepID=A0AAJ0BEA3_9PEZI|nr:hypothetical protein QBC47DRAFT_401694 [Echria macrotheca]
MIHNLLTILSVAVILGTTTTQAFTNPCHIYEQCGWVLANRDFGYTFEELRAAANSDDGSHIYDALYSCNPDTGEIIYLRWCGVAACESGEVMNDNCVDFDEGD